MSPHPVLALCTALLLAAHALSGCGSHPESGSGAIQRLTGLEPPIETAAHQQARDSHILMNADSLILSTVHTETSHPQVPSFVVHADCSGIRCEMTAPAIGFSETVDVTEVQFSDGPSEAVGSKHGITLVSSSAELGSVDQAENVSVSSYGSWMEHSGFGVQDTSYEGGGVSYIERSAIVVGDLTGARPAEGATWLGLMVGTPATGRGAGDRLQGDAALNYDLASGTLDVGFSSIRNIDRGAAHSMETVLFNDLTIDPDGTFRTGRAGDLIQGGFYGPGHAEAAGVFERSNIVGAFGAKRQ